MRPLSQPLASDSQKEPNEQFPFPNSLAELQSRSIWPRSLISLFFRDVSFWPSSHGQNLGQFLDECVWIFLILSVLTRSVVPFPHVVFSALFLPCLALSRRLASMPVLEVFCYQASCQEMPSSGKRETENFPSQSLQKTAHSGSLVLLRVFNHCVLSCLFRSVGANLWVHRVPWWLPYSCSRV